MLEVKTQTELHLWHKRSNFKLIAVVQGTFHALNWRAHKRTFSYLSFWGFSCNFNQLWKLHDPTISFENLCREQTRFTGRSNMQFNTNAFLEILLQPPPAYLLCPVWYKKNKKIISVVRKRPRDRKILFGWCRACQRSIQERGGRLDIWDYPGQENVSASDESIWEPAQPLKVACCYVRTARCS